ncbi:hypothetical protein LguiB_002434 [Lonicera macranthoides]
MHVDPDLTSMLELDDYATKLRYLAQNCKYYHLIPDADLDGGLSLRCKNCGEIGHKIRTCQGLVKPKKKVFHVGGRGNRARGASERGNRGIAGDVGGKGRGRGVSGVGGKGRGRGVAGVQQAPTGLGGSGCVSGSGNVQVQFFPSQGSTSGPAYKGELSAF